MNRIFVTIACWTLLGLAARVGCAGVVVLQNWTPVKIDYTLRQADGQQSRQSIAPSDIASIPTDGADHGHPGRRPGRPQLPVERQLDSLLRHPQRRSPN